MPFLSNSAAAGRIRLQQLQAVDQLIPAMMVANIICSGALALLLYHVQPLLVVAWFVVIAAASIWRLLLTRRRQLGPQRDTASPRAITASIRQAALMALCFTIVPAWLLSQVGDLAFASIICLATGFLWGGGLVLVTIPGAAMAYISVVCATMIAGVLASGGGMHQMFLCFLFLIGTATVVRSVKRHSELFEASQLQQNELRSQGALIGLLLKDFEEQGSDWLWETDAELRYHNVSHRFAEALGRSIEAIQGIAFGSLLPSAVNDNETARRAIAAQVRSRATFRDFVVPFDIEGEQRWWSFSGRPFFAESGEFLGYRGVCADVSAAKRAEMRIAHLAHHDALTDLPNRALFAVKLDDALALTDHMQLALLSLDLDGFKAVNDRYGHLAGDALLIQVAERLQGQTARGDTIARLGGDEFVILQTSVSEAAVVEEFAARLIAALKEPFAIDGNLVSVGLSIGIAMAPSDGDSGEALLRNVDAALYRAKEEGRGTFRFFAADMDHQMQQRRRLIQDLRLAISRGELAMHYQPYINAGTGVVTGCEALLRWKHRVGGYISPAEFIPLAEESGQIVDIGAWALREACREAASWPGQERISVNVSTVQFQGRDLPDTILCALAESGLQPARLEIEVTETVLMANAEGALDILRRIRALGARIALDDFGTGYSSLSYLRLFPFDKVKIDRSFVNDLITRRDSQVIVRGIRDIAEGLGMSITAEGVETVEQADHLRRTGCHELQGYLFSRPVPAEQLGLFSMVYQRHILPEVTAGAA